MTRSKHFAALASGILGFILPTYFAWTVYRDGIPQNLATWSMVLLLDFLGLVLVYRDGNRRPFLQLGWCVAAICILLAVLIGDSPWQWGMVETVSVTICLVAVWLWLTRSAHTALFAYLFAFFVSGMPLAIDFWHVPQPSTLWLWLSTVGTCGLALYGAEKRDMAHLGLPWVAIVLNSILAILCMR
ncbi:MAG: hypothetical protein WDN67_05230 [Candidatus Moraniibacteriota bacterium]